MDFSALKINSTGAGVPTLSCCKSSWPRSSVACGASRCTLRCTKICGPGMRHHSSIYTRIHHMDQLLPGLEEWMVDSWYWWSEWSKMTSSRQKKRTLNHRPGRFRSTTPFWSFNGTSQGDLVIHLAHLKLLRWELFRCHRIRIQDFDPNVESMFTVCICLYKEHDDQPLLGWV